MSNINTVTVSGNLTRDFEVKSFGDDGKVGNVGIAVTREYKKGDDYVKEVSFFDVTVWGRYAELCARKLKKGDGATISGRLKQDTWETDEGKRSKVVIIADQIDSDGFFRSKDEDNAPGEASSTPATESAEPAPTGSDDDIPF